MTAPYKKRAKAGWNSDKAQSNRDERNYESTDITDQTTETVKFKASKKLKRSAKEDQAMRLVDTIRRALRMSKGNLESLKNASSSDWLSSVMQGYYQKAKAAIPKLQAMQDSEELSPKVRRHVKEILEQV